MAQENGLRFKLVYTHFGSTPRTNDAGLMTCPMPNGNPQTWYDFLNKMLETHGEQLVLGQFRPQLPEFDCYQTPESPYIFRHHNFFGYFTRRQGMYTTCVTEQQAEQEIAQGSTCTYLYPIEIEWRNLRYLAEGVDYKDTHGNIQHYRIEDTITPRLIKLVQQGRVKIVISNIIDPAEPTDYYDRVDQRLAAVGIPTEHIVWLQGCVPKSAEDPNRVSKSVYLSSIISLTQAAENYQRYPCTTSLGYVSDIVRPADLNKNHRRPKRFLCFNRSMNRPARIAMALMALKHDLLKDSTFSFVTNLTKENLHSDLSIYVEPGDSIDEYAKKIIDLMPYEIDTQHLSDEEKQGFSTVDNNRKDLYADTYFHIASETRMGNERSCFMSEKTWRPILNLQPFIHFGGYHALKKLHELGFKTFGHVIDESYDNELDPVKRFKMAEQEVLKINKLSMDELHDLYYSLTDILIHNQQLVSQYMDYDPLEELNKLN